MEAIVQPSPQNLFTRQETATKLRICLTTLDKLVSNEKISSVVIGKRRLFSEEHIEAFINKGGSK